MLSIGPYVVVREIPSHTPGKAGDAGKTYRATDRLTGIPVLLHHLSSMTGLPELPPHPALLPFTDIVVQAGEAFLITELPPNAVPARDPVQAARGALMALAALHEHGLAHGALNAAQLWSVDGPVRLAGGGRFGLGPEFTVARDLRDLVSCLDELGGLPPALDRLRADPHGVTAREALAWLQSAEAPPERQPRAPGGSGHGVRFQATGAGHAQREGGGGGTLPNLDPLSLLNHSAALPQTPSFVNQAVLTSAQELSRSNTDPGVPAPEPSLPFQLDITQWDLPDFMAGSDAVRPVEAVRADSGDTGAATTSLGWQDITRPLEQGPAPEVTTTPDTTPPPPEDTLLSRQGRRVRAAASQARQRLKQDSQRLRALQEVRRDEAAAQLHNLEGQVTARPSHRPSPLDSIASGEALPDTAAPETPQERRRREHQARLEEEELAGKLVEKQGPAPRPTVSRSTESEPSGPGPAGDSGPTVQRQRKSVKMRWDERTNSWQRVDGAASPQRAALPVWVWPLLAATALLLVFLGTRPSQNRPEAAGAARPSVGASATESCCTVDFRVTGGTGKATISIVNTTSQGTWSPGQSLGQVPGSLRLPGKGRYTLNVTSEGFTPANLDITVPSTSPVTINLGR